MRHVTVMEHEQVVEYVDGRITRVLGPGRHRIGRRSRHERFDLRERALGVPGQEVLTADAVGVRISMQATWRVADVRLVTATTASVHDTVYASVQIAARDAVAGVEAAGLVAARNELAAQVTERCAAELSPYGVELTAAAFKDVSFPGDLKRVFAQVAAARQEALATLERARGETAALRSLANAAKLLENNPTLLRLRTLQAAESANATVVVTQ